MTKTNKNPLWLVLASAMALGLAGCSGDDGKDGQDGAPGTPGNPGEDGKPGTSGLHIDMAEEALAQISGASYADGIITVDFDLANRQGVGLFGLSGENPDHDFRFSLAQLELAESSELKQWMSLLNEATNDAGTTFEQGFEKLKDCPECLVDHGDGTYTYTFVTDLSSYEDAAGVVFDPDLTQRIAIEMQFEYASGHELAENAHYDWIPSTDAQEGIETRDLVAMETCYTCHQPDSLKAHGGRRLDMENCQSCHNGVVSDPNGVSVELGHMIHAIHMGPNRKGMENGVEVDMPYTVQGYHGPHAFDYPAFPTKPFMDCAVCHVADDTLVDGDLWKANANGNACTGCHTDSPVQHGASFQIPDGMSCVSCHGTVDHTLAQAPYAAAKDYSVEVSNVAINAQNLLTFDVKVLDDQGNTVTEDEIYQQGYSNPYMVVSWDVEKDYPAQETASDDGTTTVGTTYDHRRFSLKGDQSTVYADGVFSVVTQKVKGSKTYVLDLPADIASRSLEILPVLKVCFEPHSAVRTACTTEGAYPAYVQTEGYRTVLGDPDATVADRRAILDEGKCFGCHSMEFYHDSNGVNCISCHTNDKKLKTDSASGGLKSTSFMYKGHKAEGHNNGHGGSGTVLKTDCMTCHSATEGWGGLNYGFELGRNAGQAHALPAKIGDPAAETWYASSDTAACMSCHQKYLSDAAMVHIRGNGGYFGAVKDDAKAAQEACATCHSPEKVMAHHGHEL
ncbi:OmcA/MtrC family decaheme c-type cytochrome [Halomonas denitrificans]|nr:OmcA/MtrC family decaheme c-type cytochrome [Halomonas denitrificans]